MNNKDKKTLFLTGIETGLESILQREINMKPENMLVIQSHGPVISHPYGDIMRSIIIAIYQENVEEICVVGTKDNGNGIKDFQRLFALADKDIDTKLKIIDYLFENCQPEFFRDWLKVSEDVTESIKRNVEIIRRHPLVPSHVKVHGLVVETGTAGTGTSVPSNHI